LVHSPGVGQSGYRDLFNLDAPQHCTVFLTDFLLPSPDVLRIRANLAGAPTRIFFLTTDSGPEYLRSVLTAARVDLCADYVSVQAMTSTEQGLQVANSFFTGLAEGDFARLELPWRELGFLPSHASYLLDVVMRGHYQEQDAICDQFFSLLSLHLPYEVVVETLAGTLTIQDTRPWFQLAGRLQPTEQRILPGGEVTYVGSNINGAITLDGAVLATPQRPPAWPLAARLGPISATMASDPITLQITAGRVTGVASCGNSSRLLASLVRDEAYRDLTELGISFNRACASYVHDWPAASNEGRPGVHVAIGGDPDPEADRGSQGGPLVHIDLMAATTAVSVNGYTFLRTSRESSATDDHPRPCS
jgi:hypothetical protein